jgi:hypothetical protein
MICQIALSIISDTSERRSTVISPVFSQGGPVLPIAFSRVSGDGRLTLVIDPQSEGERLPSNKAGRDVETRYAVSTFPQTDLNRAIKNLRKREGCAADCIGYANLARRIFRITQLSPTTGNEVGISGTIRAVSTKLKK